MSSKNSKTHCKEIKTLKKHGRESTGEALDVEMISSQNLRHLSLKKAKVTPPPHIHFVV